MLLEKMTFDIMRFDNMLIFFSREVQKYIGQENL